MMAIVRPVAEEDLLAVAELHARIFGSGQPDSLDLRHRAAYLRQVFFERDAGDHALPSYVGEEYGKIVGFLGVIPRTLRFMGKPLRAAVSSQFIVDPASRSRMVGLRLLKEYFQGPQDLSIADEANDSARTVWEGFGGMTASLYSFYWTRVLRPSRYALAVVRNRRGWKTAATLVRPIGGLLDAIAVNLAKSPFRRPACAAGATAIDDERLLDYVVEFQRDRALHPDWSLHEWQRVLRRAEQKEGCGIFNRVAVTDDKGVVVGVYLYYLNRDGTSEVLQIVAQPRAARQVFGHLLDHAWRGGAAAVSGRLQPEWMQVLSENRCLFHRGPWMLVHAKRPDLCQAFYEGTASFSRMEGEWCLRYR